LRTATTGSMPRFALGVAGAEGSGRL
jgi:hypothetical protein